MALMENRPAQQGLVQKSMTMLHLETCGMQPVGWRKAEPSMATPAVHIAPWEPMQGCWSGGQVVVCASTVRKMDKKATGASVHAGICGYVDGQMVISDRQCKWYNSELGARTALHLSVSRGVIQRK